MRRLKLLFIICIAFLTAGSLKAQDIHFSQFYLSPLNLNPAMTGVMNCNIRLVANYRNQWASVLKSNAYNTYSVSYDQRVPVGRYDYFGIGGTLWGDRAGELDFATTQGRLSLAYSKKMGGYRRQAHYLVLGSDIGVSQRSIDFQKARFGSQHDGGGNFNPNLPSREEFLRNNFMFADISAGILWFSVFDEDNSLYFGGAYSHLNRANQSFDEEEEELLFSKFTVHAGGEFMIADRLGLVPGVVMFRQGPSFELNGGTSFKFLLGGSRRSYQAFQAGVWMRLSNHFDKTFTGDAVIISTRFDYEQISIGFSYDVNVSSLKNGFQFQRCL